MSIFPFIDPNMAVKAVLPMFREYAYGCEIGSLIGSVMSSDILQSELRRFIIETLMVNPYIVELSDFKFNKKSDGITVEFNCETVYEDAIQNISFEGVSY